MASPNIYASGLGGSTGDELCSFSNLTLSGNVWYLQYSSGTDAASPAGKDRTKPLKTLAQAHTNAAAGDIICCLTGHQETLTGSQTFNKAGIRLVSEGSGTANKAAFTHNGAFDLFSVTAAGVVIGNINFPTNATAATSNAKVMIQANGVMVRGCYFSLTVTDGYAVAIGAGTPTSCEISNSTFISTSTSAASQPTGAFTAANASTDLRFDNVTVDGGSTGWSGTAAINITAAATRLTMTNVDLLGDSDIATPTGSVYTIHIRNKSGSARLVLAS